MRPHSYGTEVPYDSLTDFESRSEYDSPYSSVLEAAGQRGLKYGITQSGLDRGSVNQLNQDFYDPDTLEPIENLWLSSEEAKEQYGISVNSGQKITRFAAEKISEFKKQDEYRNLILNNASKDFGTQASALGVEMVTNLLDPINLAASFIPIVSQARSTLWAERFGPTAARLFTGAIEGAAGNALLEPFTLDNAKALNYDYDEWDSFMNIAAGGIVGAGLHAGFGKVGDVFGISTWSRHVERGRIKPADHHTATRTALSQALQDQKVEVSPIIRSAIERDLPNLDAISAVRMIKSAKDSAAVFDEQFAIEEMLSTHYDEIASMMTDAERQVLDATSSKDILDAQVQLGSDINLLTRQLEEMQQELIDAPAFRRTSLAREMARISDELEDKQEIFQNFLETRKLTDELIQQLEKDIDELAPESRAGVQPADENFILNIERYKDKDLKNLDEVGFDKIKSEADKALLRKAVLMAQDLNQLDKVDQDGLIELATNQNSLSNKWYYAQDVVDQMDENLKNAPKEFNDVDAQKALDDIIAKMDPEELAEMDELDEKISLATKFGKALQSAATCVIQGIV